MTAGTRLAVDALLDDSRPSTSRNASTAPSTANPAPTSQRRLEALGQRDAAASCPASTSESRARVGDRGQDRQAERAADLLGRVDQPGRQARLVRLDARHRGDRHRHEREAEAEAPR